VKRVLALVLLGIAANAQSVELKLDSVKYTLGMSGDYVESDSIKARVLSIDAGLQIKDSLNEDLFYHVRLLGNFENGTNKATGLTAEYEPNQAVNLWEGGLVYSPLSFARFEVGAINQNQFNSPLLVWNTAFAGLTEQIRWNEFYVRAQQAIPNNNILSRRIGGIDEGTPMFYMETIGFDFDNQNFKFKTEVSRFAFKELSSQVALTSQDFGNSVVGANQSARFLYGYKGTNVSGETSITTESGWKIQIDGQYIFNEDAPDGRNNGMLTQLGIGSNHVIVKVGLFKNESDTAPAFYNARLYGHNNMQGTVVTLQGEEKEYSYRLQLVNGKPIEQNIRQSDMTIINFMLVRFYEL
jgi:hypothetical protein